MIDYYLADILLTMIQGSFNQDLLGQLLICSNYKQIMTFAD